MARPAGASPFAFLSSRAVIVVTIILAVQIALFYGVSTKEYIPHPPPLEQLVANVGPWQTVRAGKVDDDSQRVLKADDTLDRVYVGPTQLELFIAFFKSQRAGVAPHSPKVCLPGSGWTPEESRIVSLQVPGEAAPIPVNRYIISKDDAHSLVMYWYQGPHRATADEYLSKLFVILDSLRYHRSDEALIRVIADPKAENEAIQFIRDIYQPLKQQMWENGPAAAVLPGSPLSREPLLAHVP